MTNESAASTRGEMQSQFGGGGGGRREWGNGEMGGMGAVLLSRDERPTVMSPRFAHPRDLLKRTHFVRLRFH